MTAAQIHAMRFPHGDGHASANGKVNAALPDAPDWMPKINALIEELHARQQAIAAAIAALERVR